MAILFSLVAMYTFTDAPTKFFDALLESVSNSTSKESGPYVHTLQWSLYGEQLTLRFVKTPKLGIHASGYIQSTYVLHWFLAELLKSLLSASRFTAALRVLQFILFRLRLFSLWQFLEPRNDKSSLQSPHLHHAHALRTIFGTNFSEMEILWFPLTLIDT